MARERVPLSREAWWLLFISGLFALSVSLSNTFVNVYLWKVDKDFRTIGLYNIAVYLLVPVMFFVAGWIAKRRSSVLTLRSGVLLHAGFYALTLWGGKWLAGYPFVLGMLMGTAAGFYWCSFNDLSLRFTSSESRDRFYGMNGVAGSIAGMVAPPVAGFLISFEDRLGGLSGYHLVFGLSLGFFILASFISVKLSQPPLHLKFQFSTMFQGVRDPSWRRVLLGSSIYGLREGVFIFLIALLLYIAMGSEMELGEFFLLQSALSFGAFFLVSRFVHPHNRKVFMGIGAALMACCATLFLFPLRTTTLVWYGAAIAVCLPLFLVPLQGTVFDTIGRLDKEDDSDVRMEHIVMREAFTNAGRVAGVGSFLIWIAFDPTGKSIPYLAFAMGFVQLVTWWILHRIPNLKGSQEGKARVDTPTDGLSVTRRKAR